ncbi:hypothetical protein PIB30_086460 [Stylosanthes scabra]|uniref:Uncharacterized protein n=1 Tax=Stylosanthes scabra TaxID=79078 RepID=A0ABU6STQ5_9FABA|nr:hypothetical protein [Stylosanthes scabra]
MTGIMDFSLAFHASDTVISDFIFMGFHLNNLSRSISPQSRKIPRPLRVPASSSCRFATLLFVVAQYTLQTVAILNVFIPEIDPDLR